MPICGTFAARFHRILGVALPNYLQLLETRKWRRRESNPRPKPLNLGVYMLVPLLSVLVRSSGPTRIQDGGDLKGMFIVLRVCATQPSGLSR